MKKINYLFLLVTMVSLAACTTPEWGHLPAVPATRANLPQATEPINPPPASGEVLPTQTSLPAAADPTATPAAANLEAPTPSLAPDAWKSMPIVPVVSAKMVQVYQAGLLAGRDPAHFSKIGDCQNITTYFLADFDDPRFYRLGTEYAQLLPTIDHFSGSWSRQSLAVKGGLNVAAALNPIWADPKQCQAGETPIACEIRVYNPSIVTVSMEESWSGDIVKYNLYLRKIVEYILSQNVVPILATRAELPGSSNSINETVTRIAYDYQVPLWNFWAATNVLPSHGLTVDGFHLTQARDYFDDPKSMGEGWPWRNLTALEAIDSVYRSASGKP
jgi:hypothetical protein